MCHIARGDVTSILRSAQAIMKKKNVRKDCFAHYMNSVHVNGNDIHTSSGASGQEDISFQRNIFPLINCTIITFTKPS